MALELPLSKNEIQEILGKNVNVQPWPHSNGKGLNYMVQIPSRNSNNTLPNNYAIETHDNVLFLVLPKKIELGKEFDELTTVYKLAGGEIDKYNLTKTQAIKAAERKVTPIITSTLDVMGVTSEKTAGKGFNS
jgi:hypothetical protein